MGLAVSGPVVWRGLTQAELDRAYSPSSMIEDIGVFLDAYRDRSAAVRAALAPTARLGLAYGPGAEQTLDWFPAAGTDRPVMVFVHGGYWQALHKDDSAYPAAAFVAKGVDVVAVNYTLAPHATLDAIVAEVRAAVAWVLRNAAAFGADPKRVAVAGHSAGAQLSAMLATPGTADDAVPAALVLIGGVYDLEPIRLSYVNEPLRLDPAAVARNSPLLLPRERAVPTLVVWAERETPEFVRQSRAFARTWGEQGGSLDAWEQAGRHHFDSPLELADPGSRLFGACLRLLGAG